MSERPNLEGYWQQTRDKWQGLVVDPRALTGICGFCDFINDLGACGPCRHCPVVRVYGIACEEVKLVQVYCSGWRDGTSLEDLSLLAEAIVQELDNKKAELIAAMHELWEEHREQSDQD